MDATRQHDQPREASRSGGQHPRDATFTRRALKAVGVAVLIVGLLLILHTVVNVLLLVFAGTLLAVLFGGLAQLLGSHTPLSHGWALLVVVLAVFVLIGVGSWYVAPQIAAQFDELGQRLPESINRLEAWLAQHEWGQAVLDEAPVPADIVAGESGAWSRIGGAFSTALGMIANVLFTLALGIYLAANPALYRKGILLLVPANHEDRAGQVLTETGRSLWGWLTGQFISMLIVGIMTWIGLAVLDIPLALVLGLIAGLFEFVPLVGPFVSAVPAVLIAFLQGPDKALYVALLFLGIQQLESNAIMPIVMKKAVSLPPALTLAATVLGGTLFGLPGLLLATPLMVTVMVLVRMLYVEDTLGKQPKAVEDQD